jgi:type I restriction enzyme M protein
MQYSNSGPNRQVLDAKKMLDAAHIAEQKAALCVCFRTGVSEHLKIYIVRLKSRGSQQQLLADFEDYLNGFSPNVQDILE